MQELLASTGGAHRVGITGVPGVGKSTFIDQLGIDLTAAGHRVAVLAVDPTSSRTGGSILGDKTRMERLAVDPAAFVRPSPAGRSLGGVTRATRETILLCEAAGFDVVLVETVIGQSRPWWPTWSTSSWSSCSPAPATSSRASRRGARAGRPGGGQQGRRRQPPRAELAARTTAALHLMSPASPTWSPPVVVCSGLTGDGLDELWQQVVIHRARMSATGELQERRRDQQVRWMWAMLDDRLRDDLRTDPAMGAVLDAARQRVHDGEIPATVAVDEVWRRYLECRS